LTPVADIDVPATLQATIGARIDRLDAKAKRTLQAAAVIGARFGAQLIGNLTPESDLAGLVEAELIEKIPATTRTEYAFRHPLIQKVAYDSQLRADRSKLHRRLASSIEPVDENAALIATQWEAAGDFVEAYLWHMRAGSWFNYRDHGAAYKSWQNARDAADRLPTDRPDRLSMQIAPRTLICATTFRVGGQAADTGFDELQELTTRAGDKRSLAIGMAGYLTSLAFMSHHREASQLASEFATLVESIGDPAMTVGLMCSAAQAKYEAGESSECLLYAERVIELADGDAAMGDIMVASPLAWAHTLRGTAKMCLGRDGWLADMEVGRDLAAPFDVQSRCNAALYKFVLATSYRLVVPDADDLTYTAGLLEQGEETGDSTPIALARLIRGITLLHHSPNHHEAGIGLLANAYDDLARLSGGLRRFADIEIARHRTLIGDLDGAILLAQATLDEQFATGEMISRGSATTVLVEALLLRGSSGDVDAAQEAIDRLASVPTEPEFALHKQPLAQLRKQIVATRG
jgi:adenylate cyclase